MSGRNVVRLERCPHNSSCSWAFSDAMTSIDMELALKRAACHPTPAMCSAQDEYPVARHKNASPPRRLCFYYHVINPETASCRVASKVRSGVVLNTNEKMPRAAAGSQKILCQRRSAPVARLCHDRAPDLTPQTSASRLGDEALGSSVPKTSPQTGAASPKMPLTISAAMPFRRRPTVQYKYYRV